MVSVRSDFKRSLRVMRYRYDVDRNCRLNDLEYKYAKEYWKVLKGAANSQQTRALYRTLKP